jgi:hypothetical protein
MNMTPCPYLPDLSRNDLLILTGMSPNQSGDFPASASDSDSDDDVDDNNPGNGGHKRVMNHSVLVWPMMKLLLPHKK